MFDDEFLTIIRVVVDKHAVGQRKIASLIKHGFILVFGLWRVAAQMLL
jgi:hypothetical protein